MKKILFFLIGLCFSSFLFADIGLNITNRFGFSGEEDGIGILGNGLGFKFNFDSPEKSFQYTNYFGNFTSVNLDNKYVSGQFYFAANSILFDSNFQGDRLKNGLLIGGYGLFSPIKNISIIAGTDTRNNYCVKGGQMFTTNGGYIAQANMFPEGIGIIGDFSLGICDIRAAAGISTKFNWYLNAGAEVDINVSEDLVLSAAGVFQNFLNFNGFMHFALFFNAQMKDISVNAGVISNLNDDIYGEQDPFHSGNLYLNAPADLAYKLSAKYDNSKILLAGDFLFSIGTSPVLNNDWKRKVAREQALMNVTGHCDNPTYLDLIRKETFYFSGSVKAGYAFNDMLSAFVKYRFVNTNKMVHYVEVHSDFKVKNSSFRIGVDVDITNTNIYFSFPLMWTLSLDF